jgi:heavy metal translocating P-type ATPase
MSSVLHSQWFRLFFVPSYVFLTLVVAFISYQLSVSQLIINLILLSGVVVGSFWLVRDTIHSLLKRDFSLDYIALLAIVTALATGNFPVAGIIVLMLAGGGTLENYGSVRAKQALTKLASRIPQFTQVLDSAKKPHKVALREVKKDDLILVRKGEVIPLDGILIDKNAEIDESSLTGEALPREMVAGDSIRSGTLNAGQSIIIRVTHTDDHSTYRQIVQLVEKAQSEKSPLIRLADKYSGVFTLIALALAGLAWFISGSPERALAVLVVATPCPLILATPIALLGGMSAAARERIILKRLSALEVLSRVNTLIFDKTGTITLGKPELSKIEVLSKKFDERKILALASSLERHSMHPLARAIVEAANKQKTSNLVAHDVKEIIGKGIEGTIDGRSYRIGKALKSSGLHLTLFEEKTPIAHLLLEDHPKKDTTGFFSRLKKQGYEVELFTGDSKERTQELLRGLSIENLVYTAECTPEMKLKGIRHHQKHGDVVAMVGDGLNDAPALAQADVGLAFSHEEHTSASETADGVFLGSDIHLVEKTLRISKRTIHIAKESIFVGIGLSILAMLAATAGWLPPLYGAFLQEVIDVAVIVNALRASRQS